LSDSLNGREIVLAGGTGGLGSASLETLSQESVRLIVSYRANSERAARFQSLAKVVQADLASEVDRGRLLDSAPNMYGLVIFSGDPARVSDPAKLEESMRRSHEINYLGPILLAREAAARMQASRTAGAIVLFSTMQAASVFPGSTAYAAQKAALLHATKILAKECRGKADIRVNVICPGVNAAGMAEASIASGKYDRYIEENIIPRFGHAADVARAVRFFLEPDNYITGQVLTIDGGLTL
jgi:NAD(P)-dependent dehydrogenase (short-subunit alcohol dehydrogenase family)